MTEQTTPDGRRFAIIEAPSALGLSPRGVEQLPQALLKVGLADGISARNAGRVAPPPYDRKIDPVTRVANARGIALYTSQLADAVETVLGAGEFPVVLGGDCSILLGPLLALRRSGRSGLLFLDAHADFYQPEAEPHGEAASMELALATGHGPALLTTFESFHPLVRETDIVVLGRRDAEDAAANGSQRIEDTAIHRIELSDVHRLGMNRSAAEAVAHVARSELDGFWIHLDADVLDDAVMPAVDYRLPGGLALAELATALRTALASGCARGITITIFNPKFDSDGRIARIFADAIVSGLTGAA